MKKPGYFRLWWFEVRWLWRNRFWRDTRQKHKAYYKDFNRFRETGVTPW